MFGKNAVISQSLESPHQLKVKEIFHTIQGEGPYAGMPAVFIRLGGCNLRCWFCDTDFESDLMVLSPTDILSRCRALMPHGLVVITGGEPLIQDIFPLCERLSQRGYRVQIETAGTVWVKGLEYLGGVELVCSPKTGKVHPKVAEHCWHWKYIIRSGELALEDGLPETSTQIKDKGNRLYRPTQGTIWVQPMDEHDEAANKRNLAAVVDIAMRYRYRVSLQMHKILGVE